MKKLFVFAGATIGSSIGWWLGDRIGLMTAFMVSIVGSGVGMYFGARASETYQ
jgi:hypothetical protein